MKIPSLLLLTLMLSTASAATDYPLPNAAVVVTISYVGNACSFSSPVIKAVVNGMTFSGPVTTKIINAQGPYGSYFFGWAMTGTLTAGTATAAYAQDWEVLHSGGRGYTCHLDPKSGDLSVN
jgi:hypothetical protein